MRIVRSLLCLTALLAVSTFCNAAEEVQKNKALSLEECIEIAMRGNVDVLTAKNNVTAAKNRSVSAKSDYLPQMSVQNNAFTWGSDGVLNKTTTGTALTVSQNIFDGGLREANVQSAKYGMTQNTAKLTRTVQTVDYNVSKSYYEVLRARHLAGVAEANVNYNKGLLDQVQARAEVGAAAKIDILPIEAQLASARVSLLSAQNTVRTSAIQLQNIMGLTSQPGFDIAEVDETPAADSMPLDEYVATALKSRPDILENQAAIGSAKALVKSAKISLYPRPAVTAEYQRQVSGGFTTGGTQVVGGIVYNIFNGGANRAAYKEAKANQANAELQEEQMGRDIRSEVEEAYYNLTNAQERVTASALSLKAADNNYQAQKERYSQGLGTTLDLLNAEVQFVTAQSDDVQARYDYYIAVAQMEYAVGKQGGAYEK
ncbi:MAG: TolC family protein [Armatimonadota bacterium]